MIAALTRDMPANSLLDMVGMPISAPPRREKLTCFPFPTCVAHATICVSRLLTWME
jgi:hypothetical protein